MPVQIRTMNSLAKPENSWALWSPNFAHRLCLCCTPKNIQSFMIANAGNLRPDVVFLGYNPTMASETPLTSSTTPLTDPFQSFHVPPCVSPNSTDYRLKRVLQDRLPLHLGGKVNKLKGSFMTDLYSDVGPDVRRTQVTCPTEQLSALLGKLCILLRDVNFPSGSTRQFTLIAFGKPAAKELLQGLGLPSIVNTANPSIPFAYQKGVLKLCTGSRSTQVKVQVFGVWHFASRKKYADKLDQFEYINNLI